MRGHTLSTHTVREAVLTCLATSQNMPSLLHVILGHLKGNIPGMVEAIRQKVRQLFIDI